MTYRIRRKPHGPVAVSLEDQALLMNEKWHRDPNGYVARCRLVNGKPKGSKFHRILMNPPAGMVVDHKNGDILDNRRENLRVCTRSQNGKNVRRSARSGFRGVYVTGNTIYSEILADGVRRYLGSFPSKMDAAKAYDNASRLYHGEYGILNFPTGATHV